MIESLPSYDHDFDDFDDYDDYDDYDDDDEDDDGIAKERDTSVSLAVSANRCR